MKFILLTLLMLLVDTVLMLSLEDKQSAPTPTFAYVVKAYCAKGFSPATVEPSDLRGTAGPDGKYYACILDEDSAEAACVDLPGDQADECLAENEVEAQDGEEVTQD